MISRNFERNLMRRILIATILAAMLSGCASTVVPPPKISRVDRPVAVVPLKTKGLEAVIGKDKDALIRLFGTPRLDVIEVSGRKLQFAKTACILDAYLYTEGGREVVTYIDARRSDGAEVDRVACVNALQQR
jgi:hypothetical protein